MIIMKEMRERLMQKDFCTMQVIISISSQISHVGFEYFLKQKFNDVSNSSDLRSK